MSLLSFLLPVCEEGKKENRMVINGTKKKGEEE